MGIAPVARRIGASGPTKNSFFTSSLIWMSLSHARNIVSTQSQLDVCGAPTSTARCGTVPTVRHRASRSRRRARLRRTRKGRLTARRYRLRLRRGDEALHQHDQPLAARLRQVTQQRPGVVASARRAASARTSGTSGSRCRTWVRRSVASRRRSSSPRLSRSSTICTMLAPLTPMWRASSAWEIGPGRLQCRERAEVARLDAQRLERHRELAVHPVVDAGDQEADALAQRLGCVRREIDLGHLQEQATQLLALLEGEPGRDRVLQVLGVPTPAARGGGALAVCGSGRRSAGRRGCGPASPGPGRTGRPRPGPSSSG